MDYEYKEEFITKTNRLICDSVSEPSFSNLSNSEYEFYQKSSEDKILMGVQYLQEIDSENLINQQRFLLWMKLFKNYIDLDFTITEVNNCTIGLFKTLIAKTNNSNLDYKIIHSILKLFSQTIQKNPTNIPEMIDTGLVDLCLHILGSNILLNVGDALECLTTICKIQPEYINHMIIDFSPPFILDIVIERNYSENRKIVYNYYYKYLSRVIFQYCSISTVLNEMDLNSILQILQYLYKVDMIDSKKYIFRSYSSLLNFGLISIEIININFQKEYEENSFECGVDLCKLMKNMFLNGWNGENFPYDEIIISFSKFEEPNFAYHIMDDLAFILEIAPIEFRRSQIIKKNINAILYMFCTEIDITADIFLDLSFQTILRIGKIFVNL